MQPNHPESIKTPETQEQLVNRINLEVANFFETKPLVPDVKVYDSKDEFINTWLADEIKEVPDWIVAFADYSVRTHILSPNIIPSGNEPTKKQRFEKVLKHETTHHYVRQINKELSKWFNEGVSMYVAGQNNRQKGDPKTITIKLLDQLVNTTTDERIYWVGRSMVDMIMEDFDKEKLIELIAMKNKDERYVELKRMFEWLS